MGWSPIGVGDGRPSHHTFTTDSGTFSLVGVTNANIVLHMQDMNSDVLYICTGAWNITDATNGKADFTPGAADLASTGPFGRPSTYLAYPVVTLATGPVAMDAQTLVVKNWF